MSTTQPTVSTGAMLALYPDRQAAEDLAVPGGEPVEELHVTVAYLGKAAGVDINAMMAAALRVTRNRPAIQAAVSGHARFTSGDEGDVVVALVDSPVIEQLRRDVVDALQREGITLPQEHGYTAHCTLQYLPEDADSPVDRLEPAPLTFTALTVVHGQSRTDLPFTGLEPASMAERAREAYAEGWAASGGPMTDRVKAGCVAAVDLALARASDPGVLEATLHLGHLEGIWAKVYDRRDELHAKNIKAILKLWRPLVAGLDVESLIRQVRHDNLGESLTEATVNGIVDRVLGFLRQLLHKPNWRELRKAVAEAITLARAEGRVGALALAADQLEHLAIDWSLAFEDAYRALEDLPGLLGDADTWLTRLIGSEARELGNTLARLTREGASPQEMQEAVAALLGAVDPQAVIVAIDQLTATALSQGAIDLYASEGVDQVEFITAGDQRVCQQCADIEADNPYSLLDCPVPAIHPSCRCTVAAVIPLGRDTFAKYLT